ADLVADRLRAAGAVSRAAVTRNLTALCNVLAAAEVSDRSKLALVLARFPTRGYDPFAPVLVQIADDGEAHALLDARGDHERATLEWLRAMSTAPTATAAPASLDERVRVVRFLDVLRAAEAANAFVFDAWIDVCELEGLRGGLRAIAARAGGHAALLAERLGELEGRAGQAVDGGLRGAAGGVFGARGAGGRGQVGRPPSRPSPHGH